MHATMSRALLFPRPHGRMIDSTASTSAPASASIVGYVAKRSGTVWLTLASVHCAASLTLMRSL